MVFFVVFKRRKRRLSTLPAPFNRYVVHYIDGDKLNNKPWNLLIMRREYHLKLHRGDVRLNFYCRLMKFLLSPEMRGVVQDW